MASHERMTYKGRMRVRWRWLLVLGLVGCAYHLNSKRVPVLQQRAAYDMNCPETALTLTPLSRDRYGAFNTYGVSGCGQKATYILLGDVWTVSGAPPTGSAAALPAGSSAAAPAASTSQ